MWELTVAISASTAVDNAVSMLYALAGLDSRYLHGRLGDC